MMDQHNPSYLGWSDDQLRGSVKFLMDELARVDAGKSPYPDDPEYRGRVVRDLEAGRLELAVRRAHPGRIIDSRCSTYGIVNITIDLVFVQPLAASNEPLYCYQVVVESPDGIWPAMFATRQEVEAFLKGVKAWASVVQKQYPTVPDIPDRRT